jgi:hypothetical protein
MTSAERTAITSPAAGLQVYDTTTNTNEVYNGTAWKTVIDATVSSPLTNQVIMYDGSKWINQASQASVAANLFNYYNFI